MGNYPIIVCVSLAVLSVFTAIPARADSMDTFVFQTCNGSSLGGLCAGGSVIDTYTWQASSSPSPSAHSDLLNTFDITEIVTVDGSVFGPTMIAIGINLYGGGFNISDLTITAYSSKFWSGTTSSPTFSLGTFRMFASDFPSPQVGTLTISTPEPSAFSLLVISLLASIVGLFRKQVV